MSKKDIFEYSKIICIIVLYYFAVLCATTILTDIAFQCFGIPFKIRYGIGIFTIMLIIKGIFDSHIDIELKN